MNEKEQGREAMYRQHNFGQKSEMMASSLQAASFVRLSAGTLTVAFIYSEGDPRNASRLGATTV